MLTCTNGQKSHISSTGLTAATDVAIKLKRLQSYSSCPAQKLIVSLYVMISLLDKDQAVDVIITLNPSSLRNMQGRIYKAYSQSKTQTSKRHLFGLPGEEAILSCIYATMDKKRT